MKKSLFRGKSSHTKIYTVITVAIILVLMLVNLGLTYLGGQRLLFADLTPEELYTLSDEFITLIEEGDDTYSQSAEAPIAMIDKFRAEKDDPSLKINIIFCEEKDKIYGEATTRYVQQTAEQIKEEFDGYVTVEYVDVERNPSAVSKFKVTSDVIIPSTSVIVEFDGQYKILSLESFYVFAESDPSTPVGYTGEKKFASAILAVTRTSTPIACLNIDLDQYVLPEAVLTIGAVPTCDYGTPSTMEIPDSLDPYLQDHDAFLLRNHGALTVGCNLTKAFFVMEEVEFNAVICKHAMDLGAVHEISRDQLAKLMDLRKKMNLPGRHPGIEYEEEPAVGCNQAELVEAITKKVLAALGK